MKKKEISFLLGAWLFFSAVIPQNCLPFPEPLPVLAEEWAETENPESEAGKMETQEDADITWQSPEMWEDPGIPEESLWQTEEVWREESIAVEENLQFQQMERTESLFEEEWTETEEEEIIAFASVDMGTLADGTDTAEEPQYWMMNGDIAEAEEVTKWEVYREIHYYDSNGIERSAPLYCMEAEKNGMPDQTIREEAIRTLNDSMIRKILYFGYGGPGDCGTAVDPTCSHIDWSRWQNRYIFTHMALTKVYSGQYGNSNEWEYEHCGVNRFIDWIAEQTIPARDGIVFTTNDGYGNMITGKDLTVNYRIVKAGEAEWNWVDTEKSGYEEGFQISDTIQIRDTAGAGNTISFRRDADTPWQLGYWRTQAEYESLGPGNPLVLEDGASISLSSGSYIRLALKREQTSDLTITCPMSLAPVSFLIVDGSTQMDTEGVQDFGVAVYQGEYGVASLKNHPNGWGSLTLTKKDVRDGSLIKDAVYGLYAAEEIRQYGWKSYEKDALVETGTTNEKGEILYSYLPEGKYYVKEIRAAEGYQTDVAAHEITVKKEPAFLEVKEIPDIRISAEISKKDSETGADLTGAVFTVYEWDKNQKQYVSGSVSAYDEEKKRYTFGPLLFTETNKGWFMIRETVNPEGYSGSFSEEFHMQDMKPGETKLLTFEAVNERIRHPYIEIIKLDQETNGYLPDAEFTLYEWSTTKKNYEKEVEKLQFDKSKERYISNELIPNEENKGYFKVVETKNPEGYEGSFSAEIDLSEKKDAYTFTAYNKKIRIESGSVEIRKKDEDTGELLTGAVFEVYGWEKSRKAYTRTAICTLTDEKEKGIYLSPELTVTEENGGWFKIVETVNPPGYTGSWSREFRIEGEHTVYPFEATNKKDLGEITIVKKIREADITWAHGDPVFTFIAEGTDAAGREHRYEASLEFYPGCYTTDGEGYAVLQTTIRGVPCGTYRIREKQVMRYFLKAVHANTENVTIEQVGAPAYGKDPAEIACAWAELSTAHPAASVTMINEKSRYDDYSHTDLMINTIPVRWTEGA